jgi:PhnB protein
LIFTRRCGKKEVQPEPSGFSRDLNEIQPDATSSRRRGIQYQRRRPMAKKANAVPKGFHSVTPYLAVQDVAQAIDFYKRAFGAEEVMRMDGPHGKVSHGEVKIGDSIVMITDENFSGGLRSPQSVGGSTVSIVLYVKDVDPVFEQALSAGAKEQQPLANMFWGDRYGRLTDPFGHSWSLATHVEDVSPEEMARRAQEAMKAQARAAGS